MERMCQEGIKVKAEINMDIVFETKIGNRTDGGKLPPRRKYLVSL